MEQTPRNSQDGVRRTKAERLLDESRVIYMRELESELRTMKELLLPAGGDKEAAERFYRLLHTAKGSAPVFGLDRIGAAALELLPEWEWASGASGVSGSGDKPAGNWREKASEAIRLLELELQLARQELERDGENRTVPPDPMGIRGSRVLIIDDDRTLRTYLYRRLSLDGYSVNEADGVDSALALLREEKYDLILLDLMMLPRSGYDLFETMKEDPTLKWIPLIVLSGKEDVADKVRCFRLGCDDYVTKPFQYEELEARIHSLIKRTKTYEQLAFLDPLTGINNRRYFDHQLEQELQRAGRYPAPLSIVFLDIDRFKRINDTYGHTTGDQVLQSLAYQLQQNLRSSDLLARYGGEEFVAVMPNTAGAEARKAVEGILAKVRAAPVAVVDGEELRITFSAGVAEWQAGEAKEEWIHRADQAMYAAKQEGRDRVLVYDLRMEEQKDNFPSKLSGAVSRKKLLIADDDGILRSILVSKFKEHADVLEAEDGDAALRLIRSERPDAAIIDGLMPRLDGFGLLSAIRSDPVMSGIKVLMLSGLSKRKDIVLGLQTGADDYMAKPFSLMELELRVKRLLGV
jgi:two-component system, cell cycle response regulator